MRQVTTYPSISFKLLAHLEKLFLLSPFIWLMIGVFNVPSGKSVLSKLIPVVAVYCLIRFKGEWRTNFSNPAFKAYSIANAVIFTFVALHHLIGGEEFSFARTLLTVQIYLTVLPWRNINLRSISAIIAMGGIVVGLGSIYEVHTLNLGRAGSLATNPIPYSAFASIVLLSCLYAFFILPTSRYFSLLYALGTLGAITAIIFSGTRGAWLAMIIIFIMLTIPMVRSLNKKNLLITLVTGSFAIGVGVYITSDIIVKRYQETKTEFELMSHTTMDTSIGQRFQAWERGRSYIYQHPIMGTGTSNYHEKIAQDKQNGFISPSAVEITHAHFHNQYIDTLVRTGILGMLILLAWALFPVWLLHKNHCYQLRNWALAIAIIILIAGLTDVPFHHTHIVYLYSMLMGIILLANKSLK